MDAVTRILLAVCLSLFSVIAWAQGAAIPYEPTEKEILQSAFEQMDTALTALEHRSKECSKASKRVLDPALFKSIALSDGEWRTALGTLHFRALGKCVEDDPLWGKALTALMRFKAVEKYYKGKNTIKTLYDPEDLCCMGSKAQISIELRYQKLDPQVRKALESIPELNEPFAFRVTGDALGVMKE